MQFFYFIFFQIIILIKLFYEIGYLLHQIVILLCLSIPTACMLYISLPVFLLVESLIFYFPSASPRL